MRSARVYVLAALFLLLTACSTAPLQPESLDLKGDQHIAHQDIDDDVALADGDGGTDRIDSLYMFGRARDRIKTGELWKEAFVGRPGPRRATLRIVDSRLENVYIAAGFAGRMTYTVNAVLILPNSEIPLHSEGTQAFAFDLGSAMNEAIKGAVVSMANQVATVMRKMAPAQSQSNPASIANRLRELEKLFKEGVITEKDYESKKQQLLNSL